MKILNEVSTQPLAQKPQQQLVMKMIGAVAFAHLINDLIQAILPSIYPLLKLKYELSFTQIGLITLSYQLTASFLQPCVGFYTDKFPKPFLIMWGMICTLIGIIAFSFSSDLTTILISSALVGLGSSTFHPEASRVARMASGGRFGFAQSTFQVGGNAGTAIGPLLAAAIIVPFGQAYTSVFALFALAGLIVLYRVSLWYKSNLKMPKYTSHHLGAEPLPKSKIQMAFLVLSLLVLSKYFYMSSLTSFYTFYLIDKFKLTVIESQMYLFLFLGSIALGTFFGGPVGDKIGRKKVIWISVLGAAPFTLYLPYAGLEMTAILSVIIGLVMSSAFSAIVVYAQELVPTRVGLVSGVLFGLMFGISGLAAAFLGHLGDLHGIRFVYQICSYLPLIGILTVFLPENRAQRR